MVIHGVKGWREGCTREDGKFSPFDFFTSEEVKSLAKVNLPTWSLPFRSLLVTLRSGDFRSGPFTDTQNHVTNSSSSWAFEQSAREHWIRITKLLISAHGLIGDTTATTFSGTEPGEVMVKCSARAMGEDAGKRFMYESCHLDFVTKGTTDFTWIRKREWSHPVVSDSLQPHGL